MDNEEKEKKLKKIRKLYEYKRELEQMIEDVSNEIKELEIKEGFE